MNYEEVIKRIRYKAENIKAKLEPSYFSECADYVEKYRWHDLRKDPTDLPKEDDEVFLLIDLPVTEIAKRQCVAWRMHGYWETATDIIPQELCKAWRHIEPFEVEE